MPAWHQGTLADLLNRDPKVIAGELASASASQRLAPNPESMDAWLGSIHLLRETARQLAAVHPAALNWTYLIEFEVPRRSRRIDAVVLADEVICLVEWKVGATRFDRAAMWQAEQYALDLRDFHEGSRDRFVCPILVATNASGTTAPLPDPSRSVQPVVTVEPAALSDALMALWRGLHSAGTPAIDPSAWNTAGYRPTPTIVEAASMLYEHHDVREISMSGAQNLDATVDAVLDLIETCRRERRRGIAFITGSPGSGKTLAGLQVVHTPELRLGGDAAGVFLSGNRPLVEVIRAALTESAVRGGRRKREVAHEVSTFIQHAYLFRREHVENPTKPPSEHVVLFDEAQRAWDAAHMARKTRRQVIQSEPRLLLDIMNRVPEWCVVVAMVGSGQEINSGEAGLGEWGRTLTASHPDWIVRAAASVLPGASEPPGGRLFDELPSHIEVAQDDRLQLAMNLRSPRAERLNQWVDAVLRLDIAAARAARPDPTEYPMVLTRDLALARAWLRDRRDEGHRTGLLASADARRLQAWGFDTKALMNEASWDKWFLKSPPDVRGSDQLEVVATNFDCQGLEIDWAGVAWGNDFSFRPTPARWYAQRFSGSRWTRVNSERARYILNGYRVVLTRARRGQVIWVPQPDGSDPTLDPVDFDRTAEILLSTGLPLLD